MRQYHLHTTKTWDDTLRDLDETFRKWDVTRWTVDPMRPGLQRHSLSAAERRVSISFVTADGELVVLSLDTQPTRHKNLRTLALAIEDMRMIAKRGLEQVYRQRYGTDLVPSAQSAVNQLNVLDHAYCTLGVHPHAPRAVAEAAYRTLARHCHPDAGGTREQWDALQAAIAIIRTEGAQ